MAAGAELFVLLGDDVIMHEHAWQQDVEEQFAAIVVRSDGKLPFGFGCVAIRDKSFPCFPTFPVIHRTHLEIFGSSLFPKPFINQHGDPFLFEIYRRWGASCYTASSTLTNSIGGFGEARYRKANIHWQGEILTRAIDQADAWLAKVGPVTVRQTLCLDVVIPTYRCDVERLQALCSLDCQLPVALQTILVVDEPTTENLEEVRSLASFATNRCVHRV